MVLGLRLPAASYSVRPWRSSNSIVSWSSAFPGLTPSRRGRRGQAKAPQPKGREREACPCQSAKFPRGRSDRIHAATSAECHVHIPFTIKSMCRCCCSRRALMPVGCLVGLRELFAYFGSAQGFDELLCLPH